MAEQSAGHFTRFKTNYCLKTSQEDNSMDNICYLEYISRPEKPFIIFYTCTIEVNLTSTKVRVVGKPYNGVTGNGVTRNSVTSFFFFFL